MVEGRVVDSGGKTQKIIKSQSEFYSFISFILFIHIYIIFIHSFISFTYLTTTPRSLPRHIRYIHIFGMYNPDCRRLKRAP